MQGGKRNGPVCFLRTFVCVFEAEFTVAQASLKPQIHYVAEAGLELLILPPLSPKYWHYKHVHQVQLDPWGP